MNFPQISQMNQMDKITSMRYKRYLPTAFDESESILEKLNQTIKALESIGETNDEIVKQWNILYKWIYNDGLHKGVSDKLLEWFEDGTLENIINQNIFYGLEREMEKIKGNKSDVGFKYFTTNDEGRIEIQHGLELNPHYVIIQPYGQIPFNISFQINSLNSQTVIVTVIDNATGEVSRNREVGVNYIIRRE